MDIKSKIPSTFIVGDAVYTVEYVDVLDGEAQTGECDPTTYTIKVLKGITPHETLCTVIHEVLHSLSNEHGITLKHKLIHNLERPLANFFLKNFLK